MELTVGQTVRVTGTIKTREVIEARTPFVKATVSADSISNIPIVWWDSERAPTLGARVKVQGRVHEFNGVLEVHAEEWELQWEGPPADPLAQVIGFYIGCVETEAAGSTRVQLGSPQQTVFIEFEDGLSPTHGGRSLPAGQRVNRWCEQREMVIGESIISGWPMIIGADADRGGGGVIASPLLISSTQLIRAEEGWRIEPDGDGVDLNPYALDLLDIDREERDTLVRLVEETPAVEEASLPGDRSAAILAVLAEAGVPGILHLDPNSLRAHSGSQGIHNTGMILASPNSTQITRMLLEDLEALRNKPDLLSTGPAAVMLGRIPAPATSLPKPYPSVVPSTLAQDQAVTSAMESTFTVVTGPPGTGKSQVLVNVIAAAVANKQSVLFASKNNQAVDVVFERLSLISPDACIIRAGASSRRSEMASDIAKMLATPRQPIELAKSIRDWGEIETKVTAIHNILHERTRLEGEVNHLRNDLLERLDELPENINVNSNLEELRVALSNVQETLDAFGKKLGLFRRWSKHQRRIEDAKHRLSILADIIGLDTQAEYLVLRSVDKKPKRSLAPRSEFVDMEQLVIAVISVAQIRTAISEMEAELSTLPPRQKLDDRLYSIGSERITAGRALLDARWEQIRRDDPAARTAAGELAEQLDRVVNRGTGVQGARRLVQGALNAIPVWGVTNLSARTNLPLTPGLFDLVVIDEASQCDVASALPLLARARRAMIIGDRRQLIHITSLSRSREKVIAQHWGLDDDRASEFSYRNRSCFGLASSRVDESPIFLDLHFRSHPAIIGFSNEHFYDGRLEFCSNSRPPLGESAIEWRRVQGDSRKGPNGRSRINPEEARTLAIALVEDFDKLRGLGLSIGVVSPYKAQAELIVDNLRNLLGNDIRNELLIATTHRFQGDERDVIYFSPVVGTSMTERQAAFAADKNLVNVALTRARRRLVIVGNMDACLTHQNALSDLAAYVSRLEAGSFDSPLELALHSALLEKGVSAQTGVVVAGHRLDLAVVDHSHRIDIECDGAAFHTDRDLDSARDRAIEAEGWRVIRFSGRQLCNDLTGCVEYVLSVMG